MQSLSSHINERLEKSKTFEYLLKCESKATALDAIEVLKNDLNIDAKADDKHRIEFESTSDIEKVKNILGTDITNHAKLLKF